MRSLREICFLLVAFSASLCGCNGGGTNPMSLPPTGLSYTTSIATYTVGTAIAADIPTVSGGAATAYSVVPALPTGLSLSATTGSISGTPTAAAAATNYTITAANSAGSATVVLSITVKDAAPANLTYSANPAVYAIGAAIAANTPTSSGGAATSYSVSPTLPWGLSLNAATGVISGTPAVVSGNTAYTVTAYNSGGSATTTLSITVTNAAPANLSYSSNPATYTVGVAVSGNRPSNSGGDATGYTVSPALPAGLSLNANTGILAGVPTTPAASANYTITASNSAGSATAILNITIESLAASSLVYTPSTVVYTVGQAIAPLTPTYTGAAATYTVSPALPAGLSLDASSGVLSGTPQAPASSAAANPAITETYWVTAASANGNSAAKVTITIDEPAPWAQSIPNMDQTITPLAPAGAQYQQLNPDMADDPAWTAQDAASTAVSPDGNTLLVLTSGYNRFYNQDSYSLNTYYLPDSNEYVFVYDISTGAPIERQVLPVPITYHGIAWDPTSTSASAHFYVTGCSMDDVHIFSSNAPNAPGSWTEDQTNGGGAALHPGLGLSLGHNNTGNGVGVYPCAAGIALSQDGQEMVVANYYNDSVSVLTGGYGAWSYRGGSAATANVDLRPGKSPSNPAPGTPGGEYPFWVLVGGNATTGYTAYVSSIRDREIDVVNLSKSPMQVTARIPVKGQPNKMTMNPAQTILYVAEDQSDTVDVIDINPADTSAVNTVIETIPVLAPAGLLPPSFYYSNTNTTTSNPLYTGANTNSVTLSRDGTRLYVTNGNLNNVAVVQLTGTNSGDQAVGLIPTGWYPNSVSFNAGGTWMYVANAKSPTGPNSLWCYGNGPVQFTPNCYTANQYNPQLTKAGLQSFPVPNAQQLTALTAQVAANDRFSSTESSSDAATMAAVSAGVKHVIYILKENRTYDQVLGDLTNANGVAVGDGDPDLVQWGQAITPNQHNLALTFVTLDHFYASAEVSYDGWLWSTSARAPDIVEHQYPVAYAFRALSLDGGINRNVNVAIPTLAGRIAADPLTPDDPDILSGQDDSNAPDGPNDEENTGYLWNAALRAGLTVRNYGFYVDDTCYSVPACQIPELENPAATNTVVAYPADVALTPYTDPYYRGFDNNFPDFYRYKEWEREFDANYASGGLPALTLVRLMHDHTGNFGTAIDLVNTPELQEADNDYAVGLLIQKIAHSIYAQNTLIFVVEDDAQDGGDHVDSHRTIAFVAGAYVKQGATVSTPYTTIDFIRTMEEVLGLKQFLNLNDALGHPMADIFTTTPQPWSFTATPSAYLYGTQLPLPAAAAGMKIPRSTHNSKYWARVTRGLDFSDADRVDPLLYNRILWKGVMHNKPIPASLKGKRAPHDDEDDAHPGRRHE